MDRELFIVNKIAQAIFDKKGLNILALDMHPCSSLIDYVIIAEGFADRHVTAIAKHLVEILKQENVPLIFEEGINEGDWVVLDFSWIVIHLFMPGIRDKYHLESLWREAEIVDVSIDVAHLIA